ncbi:hypothetical protein, partial [Desulfobacula sp.]|uniref:hypothetical protein n=1 Tax=Desulfobacula sp. TaxID=2593537 RepID=UPI0039B87AC7
NAWFNQQSIEYYLSKVKELNPKKIHLFKKILEEKTRNIINWQHNWSYVDSEKFCQDIPIHILFKESRK